MPYVKRAQALGYEVVITNTNDNYRNGDKIVGSGSPEEHGETVWKKVVQPANAKSIAVVAHSYGGYVASRLSKKFKEDFEKKVFAVAFTDGAESGGNSRLSKIGINFVSSNKPLGTTERDYSNGMPRVSAGTPQHEMTSFSCIDVLFEFIAKMYEQERGKDTGATKKQKTEEL